MGEYEGSTRVNKKNERDSQAETTTVWNNCGEITLLRVVKRSFPRVSKCTTCSRVFVKFTSHLR